MNIHPSPHSIVEEIGCLKDRIQARLTDIACPKTQLDYEKVIQDIADIRHSKVKSYGELAYENPDSVEAVWERYFDIKRKFSRIQQLTKSVAEGDLTDLPLLVDAYRDIANYGIMGVQVIEKGFGNQPLDFT